MSNVSYAQFETLMGFAKRGVEALEAIQESVKAPITPEIDIPLSDLTEPFKIPVIVEPDMVLAPIEDWDDLLRCAWNGLIAPKPCLVCNGVRRHKPGCQR